MDIDLIEHLLYEDESESLDFKRDQYPFNRASDDEKSELLKDILAFANAWRRITAYILIGVVEVKGGRSKPVGLIEHLDDANLQQFVNSKTNKPVSFRYEVIPIDEVEIGVISVPIQNRPIFVKRDYKRVKKDLVYIRRSSSTDIADADEIFRMGEVIHQKVKPRLILVSRVSTQKLGDFVVAIENRAGSGIATAPYLELELPAAFCLNFYGIDGNGNHGLPKLAQDFNNEQKPKFAGDATTVIHPATTLDVTRLSYRGPIEQMPASIELPYKVAAEGLNAVQDKITIVLRNV